MLKGGTSLASRDLGAISKEQVPASVTELGIQILVKLGFDPPTEGEDYSALTNSSDAYDVWSRAAEAMPKLPRGVILSTFPMYLVVLGPRRFV